MTQSRGAVSSPVSVEPVLREGFSGMVAVLNRKWLWRPTGTISTITCCSLTVIPKTANVLFSCFHLLSSLWLNRKPSVSPSFSEENINTRLLCHRSSEAMTLIWFLKRCFFSSLMSLLFFSDLNMRSNQLSFWSSPWSILMAAWSSPRVFCLLSTGNATLHRRTERVILYFFLGKMQLSQPVMKEGFKHNLFVRTAVCWIICVFLSLSVLVLVTTEWETHALTFGDLNKLQGPKYCIFMLFLAGNNNT